ncbi:hypothetical protein KAX17_13245 [Candidatus Bipolaricaulota bacterium]|nr:hypothetical protein [Candidatus Bipolaricaulota bacterium]
MVDPDVCWFVCLEQNLWTYDVLLLIAGKLKRRLFPVDRDRLVDHIPQLKLEIQQATRRTASSVVVQNDLQSQALQNDPQSSLPAPLGDSATPHEKQPDDYGNAYSGFDPASFLSPDLSTMT